MVVITAHGSVALSAAAAANGAAVIDKPVMPQDLRRLLASPAGLAGAAPADGAAPTGPAEAPAAAARLLPGLRVLLVEDNPLNREVARGLLGYQGAQVQVGTVPMLW